MKMTDVAIDRPVFTTMVVLASLVLGGMALRELGVDLFPDTSFPIVSITTPYPGASPSEVEERVTRDMEEAVASINGVDEVRSYSRDSMSQLIVMFDMEADIRRAVNDVRDKVAIVQAGLPRDVMTPIVSRVDPTALPVATYAVSSTMGAIETRDWVDDELRPPLQKLEGVASVTIRGGAEREVQVELNRSAMEGAGLSVAQVAQTLGGEAFDLPSGRLTLGNRESGVTASGRARTLDQLRDIVLTVRRDGSHVRLRDVATVRDGIKEQRTLTRLNGVEAVTFEVQKQGGANTVAVVDLIDKELKKLKDAKRIPASVEIKKVIDSAQYVKTNMDGLWHHLIIGGLMAVLVIFLFMLDWRSTFISSLALPTSVIATFFFMWQFGFSLNIMSMMGLTLAIGILIDDSVVVRENIFRWMEKGADPYTAAREGTKEIALAVLATTFTIVAVFVPVAFMGGLVGGFFREFGITVAVAVVISLIVSFTLDPMLSARIAQDIPEDYHERMRKKWTVGWLVRIFEGMDNMYRGAIEWVLRHRIITVVATIVVFFGSMSLAPLMGQEFAGRGDRGEVTLNLEAPASASLARMTQYVEQVEGILGDMEEITAVATTIGLNEEANKARLRVMMTPKEQRRPIGDVLEDLRAELQQIPGLQYDMREAGLGDGSMEEAPVTLFVRGPEYPVLSRLANEIVQHARSTNGIRDVTMNYKPGAVEQRLFVDRSKAADRGVGFAAVAGTLRTALNGDDVTKVKRDGEEIPVRVRLRPEDRASMPQLRQLAVPTMMGQLVKLEDVTTVAREATPSTIERVDRQRQITIKANVHGRSLGDVVNDLQSKLDKMEAPSGYAFRFAGEAERMQETADNMGLAMGLAILFIYFVLASQFESFVHPFTIMLALPLAMVGAILALFMTELPMGMAAMIGIILLMGLVTKNSILLVDYTNQLRREGKSIHDALVEAGVTRLRPILMTSAAIILGMWPSAVSTGDGSEFYQPMSVGVIGGVITSTLLTLVVVPVVYVWLDRFTFKGFQEWRMERRAAKAAKRAAKEMAASVASMLTGTTKSDDG